MVDNTTSPSYLDWDTQTTGKNQSRSVATHPRQGRQEEACHLYQEDMNFHSDELEFLSDGIEKAAHRQTTNNTRQQSCGNIEIC